MRSSITRTVALASTSALALSRAATARPATASTADSAPLENSLTAQLTAPIDTDLVWLDIAYDPFDRSTIEHHELQWRKDATLNDYLKGLPEEAEWMVFVNGVEVDPKTEGDQPLQQLDRIGLVLIPQGGDGFKGILRVALMAVSVAISFIPGMQWWAAAAIMIGIGLVNTFLLTPKPPKTKGQDNSSYGIDGAKNSATEGIVYPVVYGDFRCAGNFSDCYTENRGDDQYLFLRTVMNDGEVEDITDIEINEQPISNFKLVETHVTKGTLTETVNPWFPASIIQVNKGQKLDTTFTTHLTTTEVDRLRLDVTFPSGLVDINKKDGSYGNRSLTFEILYRQAGVGSFVGLPISSWSTAAAYVQTTDPSSGVNFIQPATVQNVDGLIVSVDAPAYTTAQNPVHVIATNIATGEQTIIGTLTADEETLRGYVFDADLKDGSIAGPTDIAPMVSDTFVADLDGGDYTITTSGQAYISNVQVRTDGGVYPALSASAPPIPVGNGKVTVTDNRTRAIRKSFTSTIIPRGTYEVQIRRTTAADPSHDDWIDEVYLTDVAEIEMDAVAMRGTATLSLKIKLNDQLNQIPQLTALVKGSKVRTYDIEGNVLTIEKSKNPAWIGLDIICGIERGAGLSTSRIDWPRWLEFAQYCTDNNLEFNGVFDTGTNLGDALNQVLRIGHAAPVPFGTKISVAIDRERDPVHQFTQGNIIKDTFSISYLSMADRANEYEFTYYDKNDRNKAKTIRYVDPKAVTFNEIPRTASVTLVGVDNHEQAKTELWRAIYANRLLMRTITFDAWLDALNMTMGEVALIQHDMMEWATSGRVKDGCTTTQVVLDQHAEMVATANVIVHFDALKRVDSTIASVVGRKVLITKPGGANLTTLQLNSKRLIANGQDYEIAQIQNGATYHTVTLAADPVGLVAAQAVELWDTDCLEQRDVTSVTQNADGTTTLNLATALPQAPAQYASFAYGPVTTVNKPYTLVGVNGNGLEKRTLTFMEYNAGVYGPAEVEIPIPVTNLSSRMVRQVSALMMDYDSWIDPVRNTVGCRISWNSGGIINYGGADVYLSLNGGPLLPLGSAVNINELHTTLNVGDSAIFKVVAYNKGGDRAPFASAPMIGGTIDPEIIGLPGPTSFTATQTAFDTAGTIVFDWLPPLDVTGITGYELNYKNEADTAWIGVAPVSAGPIEIAGQKPGDYNARIRSVGINSGFSDWVEIIYSVTHPDISAAPVGLQLNGSTPADQPSGEFTGKDAIFTWTDAVRDEVYFLDYQVTIYDDLMNPLRTEYTVTPNYTYTYEHNTTDGAGTPRRAFNFEVRQRGRQGQISAARTMFAQNPAPSFATPPTVDGALNSIIVNVDVPADPDITAIQVYASLSDPCAINASTLVYSGLASQITIQPLAAGAQHYIKVVPVDAFGPGAASAQYVVLPTSIDDYFDTVAPDQIVGLTLTQHLNFNDDGTATPVLTATWTASPAADINTYEIEIKQDSGNFVAFAAPTNTYEWSPVLAGSTYTVHVRGVDNTGNKGNWSTDATITIGGDSVAPGAPTALVASAAYANIFLSWANPLDGDLKSIIIFENTTNSSSTATPIATVAAIPGKKGAYTRGGLDSGMTRYYWLKAVDYSGNESGFSASANATTAGINFDEVLGTILATQISNDSITAPMIGANQILARNIAAGEVQTAHMAVGTIDGDRITVGTLSAASLDVTTSLPAAITVGATGVSIGTIQSQAATGAQDPATRINAGSTTISPGKIQLTGTTTLSSLLWGGDNTLIDGGKIAANTITANKISIGVRGIECAGIEFEHNNPGANQAHWTAGTISYTDDNGNATSVNIAAGNTAAWTSGTIYIYWVAGATTLSVSSTLATARGANNVILATYRGGTDLVATYGRTVIDGTDIKTGSITADRMNVSQLSAITATIGTFQSAPSGQRVVISDSLIQVYDSSNVLRVRLGIW
jgi:membrane protein implicated in regulation of membrane protease activity